MSWTGGQYSLFRALLGTYLCVHFAALVPWAAELFSDAGMLADARLSPLYPLFPSPLFAWDSPFAATALVATGAVASLALAAGAWDRAASLVLWFLWASLLVRNPLIQNPSIPFVGWLLLAHACMPPAPYGAWSARRRVDPGGGWRFPRPIFAAAWIVLALAYSYSGYTKLVSPSWIDGTALARVLDNPLARPGVLVAWVRDLPDPLLAAATWGGLLLELLFAPLALLRLLRPWLWSALLAMHLGLVVLVDFADLSLGMVLFHLFTFDPAWLPARHPGSTRWRVYYDGSCGLCHRAVRFLLAEDRQGAFEFAPLASDAFRSETELPADLPDSILVRTAGGRLLMRSDAMLALADELGGFWRILSVLARVVPRPLRDLVYDGIAAVRLRLFRTPEDACPILPPELRSRFLT